jgi:hypothetical protein
MLVTVATDAHADITLCGDVALAMLTMMEHKAAKPAQLMILVHLHRLVRTYVCLCAGQAAGCSAPAKTNPARWKEELNREHADAFHGAGQRWRRWSR